MLGTLHLAGDDDAGRQVGDPHRGVRPVDILPAGAARTVGIDLQILFINLNGNIVSEFGKGVGGGERGMTARVAVKRRNPHQTVNSAFRLEITVGEFAFHAQCHALDPGFFARLDIDDFILEPLALKPAAVHTHQNTRPVAGLRSALS